MKRISKANTKIESSAVSSDVSMDCTCEILLDTSLSNVGDSDCDCSDCLQANLNAFNQFKDDEAESKTRQHLKEVNQRGKNTHSVSKTKEQPKQKLKRYQSTDRFHRIDDTKTKKKWGASHEPEADDEYFKQFKEGEAFTNGQLNDFLLITQYRTRKYLEERKKLQDNSNQQKEHLKDKIKKNLELLKYTAQEIRSKNEGKNSQPQHPFKWNHSKYKCECNGQKDGEHKHDCCRKIKVKKSLDSNLGKFKQNFAQNRDQIINQIKEKRKKEEEDKKNAVCPYDHCPNHHNRTSKDKIAQIQEFIDKKVKTYYEKQKKKQMKQQQKKKAVEGKMRAIDLKAKEIVSRSKKVDDNISRTSFKHSIDQYDTFSQLRQDNERRKKNRQNRRQIKQNLKVGGGDLENKIYEELEDDDDYAFQTQTQNKVTKKTTKAEAQYRDQQDQDEPIYDKIAYDAHIKPPKNLKSKQATSANNAKQTKNVGKQTDRKNQNVKNKNRNLSKGKEEEQRKKVEQEIEKKKKQIIEEYQKRNSNGPSNKEVRKQYEQKIKQRNKPTSMKAEKDHSSKDPYRTNFQTKPGKTANQIKSQGDPLLQQYTYHQQKGRLPMGDQEESEIFTKNVNYLKSKTQIKH